MNKRSTTSCLQGTSLQTIATNTWDTQSHELWEIYCKRQTQSNKNVPLAVFEDRFWQHYEQLLNRVNSIHKTKSSYKVKHTTNTPQDFVDIFNGYWSKPFTIHQKTQSMQKKTAHEVSIDRFFQLVISVLGAFSLGAALANSLEIAFVGLLMITTWAILHTSKAQKSIQTQDDTITFTRNHIIYTPITNDTIQSTMHIYYSDIHTLWHTDQGLIIVSKVKGKFYELKVSTNTPRFYTVKLFLKELITRNYQR